MQVLLHRGRPVDLRVKQPPEPLPIAALDRVEHIADGRYLLCQFLASLYCLAVIGPRCRRTSTIGHFLGPSPDIPPFFFVTIFTDFLTGAAMLGFGAATLKAMP
jgi:hypothetical protein